MKQQSFRLVLLLLLMSQFLHATISILQFGAKPNDSSVATSKTNSEALISAFQAVTTSDRVVEIPEGVFYFMNSTILGLVDVTWKITGTAILNNDISEWPQVDNDGGDFGAFEFHRCKGLTIEGPGQLHGQGYDWWWYVILTGKDHRPHLVRIFQTQDLIIRNLYAQNSPQFHFKLDDVMNVFISNVTVYVDVEGQKDLLRKNNKLAKVHQKGQFVEIPIFPLNTDGIDPAGQNVTIENCSIENFDDAVAVKPLAAGKSIFGFNCSNNMVIRNSIVKYGVGMTIGSVPPNSACNCISDILFENIVSHRPIKAIYIKTDPGNRGTGLIKNIVYKNFTAFESLWYPIWIGPQQQHQPGQKGQGCSFFYPVEGVCPTNPQITIQNIQLHQVSATSTITLPGVLLCNISNPCTDFVWDDVKISGIDVVQDNYICENVQGTQNSCDPKPQCF